MSKWALEHAVSNFGPATLEEYLEIYHPESVLHFLPPGMPTGRAGARLFYQVFFAAFPDARITIDDTVSEGNKLAARFTVEATHRGEFLGFPPSHQPISFTGVTIMRFDGDVCVERWSESNLLAALQPEP